jgi:hypothetical protein
MNGNVSVDGGTGFNTLFVYGTVLDDVLTIDGDSITGAGLDITFKNISQLDIAGLQGSDTFYIESIITSTRILGDSTLPNFPTWIRIPPNFFAGKPVGLVSLPNSTSVNLPTATANGVLAEDFSYTINVLDLTASITVTAASTASDQSPEDLAKLILAAINGTIFKNEFSVLVDTTSNTIVLQLLGSPTENDTFYIGYRQVQIPETSTTLVLPGSLSGIDAPLSIDADYDAGATKTIYIDDSGDTVGQTFTMTTTVDVNGVVNQIGAVIGQLNSSSMGAGGVIYWDSTATDVRIKLGSGTNTFIINGNTAGSETTIDGGSGNDTFIVNAVDSSSGLGLLSPLQINGNDNTFNGDTLTVYAAITGDNLVITGSTIDGAGVAGATINYETIEFLTINGTGGSNRYTVNGDSVPTVINGGPGSDIFTVNANTVPLTLNGLQGTDTFTINGNSGPLTATGGNGGVNTFTVNGSSATMTLNGGSMGDAFIVNGNSATLTLNGGAANDSFSVTSTNSPISINAGAGNDTFSINLLITAPVTIKGGGTSDALTVYGSAGSETISITASSVTDGLAPVYYSLVTSLTVNGASGNDIFDVRAISNATTLNTGAGVDTINVGSTAPYSFGVTDLIQGVLTVNGNGADTLNVDDTGSAAAVNGALTASTLTGLNMSGGIVYAFLEFLNITLGDGGHVFTISSTSAITTLNTGAGNDTVNIQSLNNSTTVNLGAGVNTVNVGSNVPVLMNGVMVLSGGIISGIEGALTLEGSGSDTLNVDDSGTTVSRTGTLTSSTLTGLGMSILNPTPVTYQVQFSTDLQTWNLVGVVASANATVNWTDPSMAGTVGSYRILEITPSGTSYLITPTVTLTSGHNKLSWTGIPVSAPSQAAAGINYFGFNMVNISLGSGGNVFNVTSTGPLAAKVNAGAGVNTINVGSLATGVGGTLNNILGALTVIGSGADTLNLDNSGSTAVGSGTLTNSSLTGFGMAGITYSGISVLNISLGSNKDTLNIQSTISNTTVNAGAGVNTINIGSLAPGIGGVLNILGQLKIVGSGSDIMNVDDTGTTTSKSFLLSASSLTGTGMAGIYFTGLATLNISAGSGGNEFFIGSTSPTTKTTLSTGSGDNTINVGSGFPGLGGTLNHISGVLTINGSGKDTFNLDNGGSLGNQTGTLTPGTITGLGLGANGILYTGIIALNINLGYRDDSFTVNEINISTVTSIDGGAGDNTAALNFAEDFAGTLNLFNFQTSVLSVGGNFTGSLTDYNPGDLQATIAGNFTGTLMADVIDSLNIGGNATGQIIAGTIGEITDLAATGNLLLNVTQGGVQREVLASPVTGTVMPSNIIFKFVYDGTSGSSPQLAIQITITGSASSSQNGDPRFDLALVAFSATAKFNLALVTTTGHSDLRNLTVDGDILSSISAPALKFLGMPVKSQSGVVLPADNIAGIEVSGQIPVDVINVGGIEGLAFGVLIGSNGQPVSLQSTLGSASDPGVLTNLLGVHANLISPVDEFRLPSLAGNNINFYVYAGTSQQLAQAASFVNQTVDNASLSTYVYLPSANNAGAPLMPSSLPAPPFVAMVIAPADAFSSLSLAAQPAVDLIGGNDSGDSNSQ